MSDLYEEDIFLSELLSNFVSKPTVSSKIKSRLGRNCSPAMTEGEKNVLRSA